MYGDVNVTVEDGNLGRSSSTEAVYSSRSVFLTLRAQPLS